MKTVDVIDGAGVAGTSKGVPSSGEERLAAVVALMESGRLDEAEAACRDVLASSPLDAPAWHVLGLVLHAGRRLEQAADALRQAVKLSPRQPHYRINLAATLGALGRTDEAIGQLGQAMLIKADIPELHNNLGAALERAGRPAEAAAALKNALGLKPDYPEAHRNRGNVLRKLERVTEAADHYRRAIKLRRDDGESLMGLSSALSEVGDAEGTIGCCKRIVATLPRNAAARSALLYTLHYSDEYDAAALAREHFEWGKLFREPPRPHVRPHGNDRSPDRRLRLGYISPDFRDNTIAKFITGALEHHDREQFDLFCYSDVEKPDGVTRGLRGLVPNWHETRKLNDADLEQLIRRDGIDILVDLRGHAAGNRLTLFTRKPAPVQVNMVGYFNTTGLSAMDWRITDAHMDPVGLTEHLNSERLMRIEPRCWCYSPAEGPPDVAEAPALAKVYVTFGSLNKIVKVSPTCARLWARVLEAVPNSRLMLSVPKDAEASVRERLAKFGLPADRLDIPDKTGTTREYLERYHQIDIALDTYPFGGITTTCDALWMGVPCVSLAGGTSVSRAGKSILHAAGLAQLAAENPEQFVKIACDLARDIDALRELRATTRPRLLGSPLMDHVGFARKLDRAYQAMWRRFCLA